METPLVLGSQRQGSQNKEKLARPPHIWTERQNAMTKSQKEVVERCNKKMIQVLLTGQACRQSSSHPHLETLECKTIFNMGRVLCFEQLLLINFRLSKWKELTSPSPSISQPGTTRTKSSTCKTLATTWESKESGHQKIGGFELRNYAKFFFVWLTSLGKFLLW